MVVVVRKDGIFRNKYKKDIWGGFDSILCCALFCFLKMLTAAAPGCECHCGRAKTVTKIVGGVETEVSEYPWQAGMIGFP